MQSVLNHYAVIDIGTNSARLLIYHYKNDRLCRVYRTVRYTRMGQDVNRTGMLHPDAMARNETALAEYKSIMDQFNVTDYYIFGTSAMRDARNTDVFVKKIKRDLNMDIHVISGESEAKFGFLGVTQSFREPVFIFDIGGGSTELITGWGDHMEKMLSLNMGCVRGTEMYLQSDPCSPKALAMLALDFDCRLKEVLPQFGDLSGKKFIGIGGTATTIAAMDQVLSEYNGDKVHGYEINKARLDYFITQLSAMTLEQRQQVVGLDEKRADVIVAGMVIMDRILSAVKKESFTVCDFDNLEGAAFALHQDQQ